MKKLRSVIFATILSSIMAVNIFAGNSVTTGVLSPLFNQAVSAVISFFSGNSLYLDDNCPLRVCGSCRPEERNGDGDCRPPSN
jgi:hypothetical protein